RGYLGVVRTNGGRLLTLINDLLEVARLASGNVTLKCHPIELTPLIESVARTLHPQILKNFQQLTLSLPTDLPVVYGDSRRVIQILMNLLSNAYKYTPAFGALSVSASAVGEVIRVDISD